MTRKISPLFKFEILCVFLNTLTADVKYPLRDCENLQFAIQMQFKNKKHFLNFLFHFWNLHQIWNIFEKKMIVIANVLKKLQTVKDLFKTLSWKRCFRVSLDSQDVNGCQTLMKSTWEHFYLFFFLIRMRGNDFQNISLIEIWNLSSVCEHIDSRWQVSCSGLWEFAVPYSNAIVLKTKNFAPVFCSIYGISIKI